MYLKRVLFLIKFGLVLTIYVPDQSVNKKPLSTLGIKTVGWQDGTTPKSVEICQNYTNVNVQHHQNAQNLEKVYEDNRSGKGLQNYEDYTPSASNLNVQIVAPNQGKNNYQKVPKNFYSGKYQAAPKKYFLTQTYSKCPPGQSGQFVYEASCNQFLNCWNGRGYAQNCAPGTLFNPQTLECDYAEKVECISKMAKLMAEPLSEKLQATCPKGFSGIIPHYKNCAKFINCNNGIEHVMDCPPGTLFDMKTNMCDFSYKCMCANGQNEQIKRDQFVQHGSQLESHQNLNSYNNIGQNKPIFGREPINFDQKPGNVDQNLDNFNRRYFQNNDNFDENPQNLKPNYQNFDQNSQRFDQKPQIFIPNPLNIGQTTNLNQNKHYGQKTHISYDRNQNRNYEQTFETSEVQENVNQNPYFTTQNFNQAPGKFYSSHGVGQNLTQKKQSLAKCPQHFTGLEAHPQNCAKFLNCANGRTHVQDCAAGTLFNPLTKMCDFPHNVECAKQSDESGHNQHFETTTQRRIHFQGANNYATTTSKSYIRVEHAGTNVVEKVVSPKWTTTHFPPTLNQFLQKHQNAGNDLIPSATNNFGTYKNKHWPPPFPSTDLNADYVFEYEDLMESEPNVARPQGGGKNWCDFKGFECGNKICIAPSEVCNEQKDCSGGNDEIDCDEAIYAFASFPNTKLAVKEVDKLTNVTLKWCAKFCRQTHCKSFNYRSGDGTCFLLTSNVGLSGALIVLPNYDYYENARFTVDCRNSYVCRNRKCISRLQICDGVNDCGDWMDEKSCKAEAFGYKIALGGEGEANSGRIEITAFGKTGYVCDDMFGLRNADVACRELGFSLGALEVRGNSHFAQDILENDTFYMMDDVSCLGNETALRDCDFNGWGIHNCRAQEIVGVVCKTPQETCPEKYWQCQTGKECLPLTFVCDGVNDCTDKSDEHGSQCESEIQVRLVNGTTKRNGRVEIRYHGIWGNICDDDFNDDAAKVICHQLGFNGTAKVKKDSFFGPGEGPIWLDQVFCKGNETNIDDCLHWDWGEHNCEHSEDVGVICTEQDVPGKSRNIKLEKEEIEDVKFQVQSLPTTCGLRSDALIFNEDAGVHFRVVQGSLARRGDYPWQASIRVRGKSKSSHWCGAVVISEKFVLTAAHCLRGFSKGAYFIVAGDYNVDISEGTEQEAQIEDFLIHEDFGAGNKVNNDIALIKLKGKGFALNKDVQAICLPEADVDYEQGMNCSISGFGSIENGKSKASHDLRAGWIPLQSNEVCKMPHVYGAAITPGMLCAGFLDEGVDACDGDSGGPLACLNEGLFTLYGITSWGQHCGYANKPGVYVRVAYYRQWIDETVKKMSQ